jgi:hypothetical protein
MTSVPKYADITQAPKWAVIVKQFCENDDIEDIVAGYDGTEDQAIKHAYTIMAHTKNWGELYSVEVVKLAHRWLTDDDDETAA